MREHSVAVFDPGDKNYNTIAFPETQVVVPLEEDIDCDPLQDDEVRLRSLDGTYEVIVKASDAEAVLDRDCGLINYNFKRVPTGFYSVSARIGAAWFDISTELMVTPKGAFFLKKKLCKEPPKVEFQTRSHKPFRESAPPAERQNPRSLDMSISFFER